jgi:putative transposase
MHWLTFLFSQKYHQMHQTSGTGHIFQDRFKSFIVEKEEYLIQLFIYIERNALKSGLVKNAEDWPHSSLWIRINDPLQEKRMLTKWPIRIPEDYINILNTTLDIEISSLKLRDQ